LLREKILTIKILFIFFVIASLLTVKVYAYDAAPDFTLTDIDGNEFSLSDFLGKVVILDFFGSRCGPCLEGMSHLKTLHEEFGGDVLAIISIGVSYVDTVGRLKEIREQYGIDWTLAVDTAGVADKYGVVAVPVLVVIDPDGYKRYRHVGPTEESVLYEEVATLIPEPPPPPPPEGDSDPNPGGNEENPASPPPEGNPDPTSPPENPELPDPEENEENPEFPDPGKIEELPEFSAGQVTSLFMIATLVALILGKVTWLRRLGIRSL